MTPQPDLFVSDQGDVAPRVEESSADVQLLCDQLDGRGWLFARQILEEMGLPATENRRRWIRALADASAGRVAGGQCGYKLTAQMTREEYAHWRNWMNSQADAMKRRVINADRRWFAREGK